MLLGICLEQRTVPKQGSKKKNIPYEVIDKGYDAMVLLHSQLKEETGGKSLLKTKRQAERDAKAFFLITMYLSIGKIIRFPPKSPIYLFCGSPAVDRHLPPCKINVSTAHLSSFSKTVPQRRQHSDWTIAQPGFCREPVSSLGTAFLLLPNTRSELHPGLGLGSQDRLQEPDSKKSDLAKRDQHML